MALRGLRGREDLTQAELAARLGVSQNAISEMENGKRPISTKMAKRLGGRIQSSVQGISVICMGHRGTLSTYAALP